MSSTALLVASPPARVLATGAHQPAPSTEIEIESAPGDLALIDSITEQVPDVVVIDLDRAGPDPLRLCRNVVEQAPATAVLGAGPEDRLGDAYQLLRLGAVGWVTVADGADAGPLTAAVQAAARGESLFHRRHAAWILDDYGRLGVRVRAADPRYSVTATEREVLDRLAAGHRPDEVAALHNVTPHAVSRHARLALVRLQNAARRTPRS